jgi:hypothetical protein
MEMTEPSEESVMVIDPRHPLCGQSFRLLGITTKQYLGRCCVVLDHASRERNIPLAVTDRSPDPLVIALFPLTVATIEHLIHVFSHIHPHPEMDMGEADGRDAPRERREQASKQSAMGLEDGTHLDRSPHLTRASLDLSLRTAATDGGSYSRQDLSDGSVSSTQAR